MNWYKKDTIDLQYLSDDHDGNIYILMNGERRTFYGASPFWQNKIKWMIQKSKIPGEVIFNRHLKNFSDPKRYKEINPDTTPLEPPQKPKQQLFPFMD